MRYCDCKDWEENNPKLNAGYGLLSVHGVKGYEGKLFEYCPWCAKKLLEKGKHEEK